MKALGFVLFIPRAVIYYFVHLLLTPVVLICFFFVLVSYVDITSQKENSNYFLAFLSFPLWTNVVKSNEMNIVEIGVMYLKTTLVVTLFVVVVELISSITLFTKLRINRLWTPLSIVVFISLLFVVAFLSHIFLNDTSKQSIVGELVVFWLVSVVLFIFYRAVFSITKAMENLLFNKKKKIIQEQSILDLVHSKDHNPTSLEIERVNSLFKS